jgi:hypothetical protein
MCVVVCGIVLLVGQLMRYSAAQLHHQECKEALCCVLCAVCCVLCAVCDV